ncbi:MAG: glutamate--tRNA ligase, partial [Candidatus Babeliales bacterium]
MNKAQVRVRFAPSPTGNLHIGGLRTAIFNWLFARHNDGKFLVRIEDTDKDRSLPEYERSILESLAWMGITSDEPIVIQSSRDAQHRTLIAQLLAAGNAYTCYCTSEALTQRLGNAEHQKYDGFCATQKNNSSNKPYAVRFNIPKNQSTISFHDLIRGTVTFDMDQFDDFIIARTDGYCTYNFVVVADDAAMEITHVIRGEDHIMNTPKQIMLYQALGFALPAFAHMPLILGPAGNRLSKRDAATSVLEYKRSGYLPDAFFNYLVRLGWAHGDQEIFTREELIPLFTLEAVGKKGSIFDQQKLDWLNGMYIRQSSAAELIVYIVSTLDVHFLTQFSGWSPSTLEQLVTVYKERAKRLTDIIEGLQQLYTAPVMYDQESLEKYVNEKTVEYLTVLMTQLKQSDFTLQAITTIIKGYCEQHALKLPTLAQPIRLALTGSVTSPGVFD